jgi:hypothetical protein
MLCWVLLCLSGYLLLALIDDILRTHPPKQSEKSQRDGQVALQAVEERQFSPLSGRVVPAKSTFRALLVPDFRQLLNGVL